MHSPVPLYWVTPKFSCLLWVAAQEDVEGYGASLQNIEIFIEMKMINNIRGGQKSQIFLATSFSELVFTAEYENRGEIG